jgi:hypothetical protein
MTKEESLERLARHSRVVWSDCVAAGPPYARLADTTGRFLASGAVTVDSNAVSVCPNPIPPSADLSVGASGPSEPVVPGSYIL